MKDYIIVLTIVMIAWFVALEYRLEKANGILSHISLTVATDKVNDKVYTLMSWDKGTDLSDTMKVFIEQPKLPK